MGIHFRQVRTEKTFDWDGAQRCVCVPLYEAGGRDITQLKLVSVFLGFAVGFSGAWGAYYTELFPQKFSALSSGISFNGGRIISTFAIPAIAGLGSAAAGMQGIFMVSMAVFVAGAVIWMFLPETYQKKEKAADK